MRLIVLAVLVFIVAPTLSAQETVRIPIESGKGLDAQNVVLSPVTYHGRPALRVVEAPRSSQTPGEAIAILSGQTFREGIIDLDLAGAPGPHAAPDDRGFVGIAFHISAGAERLKTIYLRPTNGRADDQLRRNHSTQFTAEPDWPWYRLRKEAPGQYESYVDLVAGEWTSIRVVVERSSVRLFVNGSPQPALVVTDTRDPAIAGRVALWIGDGTEAYFANLRITSAATTN